MRRRPSPPWGRGWPAAGVFISRGGPGEGVASLQSEIRKQKSEGTKNQSEIPLPRLRDRNDVARSRMCEWVALAPRKNSPPPPVGKRADRTGVLLGGGAGRGGHLHRVGGCDGRIPYLPCAAQSQQRIWNFTRKGGVMYIRLREKLCGEGLFSGRCSAQYCCWDWRCSSPDISGPGTL